MKASWWIAAISIGIAVIGLVITAAGYMESVRDSINENRIHLEQIQATQQIHFAQREDRFEELEVGQRSIITGVATSLDDLSYRIGVHAGRHAVEDGK